MKVIGLVVMAAAGLLFSGCQSAAQPKESTPVSQSGTKTAQSAPAVAAKPQPQVALPAQPGEEVSLFDGKTLGQWKVTDFGGQGDVSVKDGAIYLATGSYMTGVTWTGPVLGMNYEITLEAMRFEGSDFFCGLTFPVGDRPCTLVLGGWGGSLCGLSSLDHMDASENSTTRFINFENGKWYRVRLRVIPDRIQAWLDDEDLVDVDVTGRSIDVRIEVEESKPLGIATWNTGGAVRNIKLKKLAEEVQ